MSTSEGNNSEFSAQKSSKSAFGAVLKKNQRLKTRGNLLCCTIVEILVPTLFFAVLCLPKALIEQQYFNDEFYNGVSLQAGYWTLSCTEGYKVSYTPPTDVARDIARDTVRHLTCDGNPGEEAGSFMQSVIACSPEAGRIFSNLTADDESDSEEEDDDDDEGYEGSESDEGDENDDDDERITTARVTGAFCGYCGDAGYATYKSYCDIYLDEFIQGFESEQAALSSALLPENQRTVLAIVVLNDIDPASPDISYTLRINGTTLESDDFGRFSANKFVEKWDAVQPANYWRRYHDFVNIQNALDEALITSKLSNYSAPITIATEVKPFPWVNYSTNLGGAIAAAFFPLIFIFAFISTVTMTMKSIVAEKELRLREGMQMMGLPDSLYWASWFLSHWGTLMITMTVATIISLYSMSYTNGGLMFIYLMFWSISLIFFCYFMSCFFDRSQMASIIGSLVYVCGLAPSLAVAIEEPNGGPGYMWVCLHPACNVYMWGEVLSALEAGQLGITADTWNTSVLSKYHFSANSVFTMVIVDCFLYGFLAWYCDKVVPSSLGVKQKPWFLFTKDYWISVGILKPTAMSIKTSKEEDPESGVVSSGRSVADMEPLAPGLEADAAIRVKNLVKSFGEVKAVNGLSLTFANNHISTLLGHNGAGKTTTMQMLTGMLPPTSGEAWIAGKDIHHEMLSIRQSLGVCPQFDILWPNLTVQEHLELYAAFAGVPAANVQAEIYKMAVDVGLEEKFKDKTETLSGGQKRKLSMGIAFLGDPKVVFLDEPTSGMDPYSRRNTWEVIKKFKPGRAIILTTHFMDEADILSDRIAIMSAGRLACVGSSVYLRNRFSLGYTITLEKTSDKVSSLPVEQFIRKWIPGVTLLADVGTELSYKLPNEQTSKFADFLDALEVNLDDLKCGAYGLSNTTLEEVFLKIAEGKSVTEVEQHLSIQRSSGSWKVDDLHSNKTNKSSGGITPFGSNPPNSFTPPPAGAAPTRTKSGANDWEFQSGFALMWQQMQALFLKRLLNMRRDKLAIFTQYIGPLMFIVIAMVMANLEFRNSSKTYDSVPLTRDLVESKPASVGISSLSSTSFSTLQEAFESGQLVNADRSELAGRHCFCPTKEQDFVDDLTLASGQYDREYSGYASKSSGECVDLGDVVTTPVCEDSLPRTLDEYLLGWEEPRTVCEFEDGSCDALFVADYDITSKTFNHTLITNPTALHSLAVVCNSANSAIYKLLGGTGRLLATNHPMDDIPDTGEDIEDNGNMIQNLIVAIFVGFSVSVLSASFSTFLVWERMNNAKHLQMVSGVPKLLFWVSAYLSDLINYAFPMVLIIIIFAAWNIPEFVEDDGLAAITVLLLFFGLSAIPLAYLLHFPFRTPMNCLVAQMSFYMFLSMATLIIVTVLEMVNTADSMEVFDVLKWVFRGIPHYALCRGVFDIAENYRKRHREFRPSTKDVWDMEITGYHLLFMAIEAIVFYGLTLMLEFYEAKLLQKGEPGDFPPDEDEDVVAERQRIQKAGPDLDEEVVVVHGLAKTYPNGNSAVKPLSFSIGRGQCFGLLGVNGAGKTSTFRMLTGEFSPSAGDATVRGRQGPDGRRPLFSIVQDQEAARTVMGYCPQFDGIQPNMTAREHLKFYALIRGVPPKDIPHVVEELLDRMDLKRYADRVAGKYSGGNKRKLSVGIALVGDPPVVLLDEPSTGMDPEARRFMWDVISTTMQNRCVILTSHSMEECEALCHKVGIMVKGNFRCFGSIQHLKNRFSQGYTVEFSMQADKQPKVKTQVMAMFPDAELVQEHTTNLKYTVRGSHMLPKLFRAIEAASLDKSAKLFDDYSISQTTLEQVFVRFAADDGGVEE